MFSRVVNKFYDVATHVTDLAVNNTYYVPKQPTAILLIGSTGNGKSTLANFLLDPSPEHIYDNPSFLPARSNMPETKAVNVACRKSQPSFKIVDTPGLNESDSEDLRHMTEIAKTLNELQSISACILCIKFDSKIDMQFKATIDYYQKLLPRLFEENTIVVITNYTCDERSKMMRSRQGIDDKTVIENILKETGKLFDPPRQLQDMEYEYIDGLPYGLYDRQQSLFVREIILKKANTIQPVSVPNLKVMKTLALKRNDERSLAKLNGEINGYKSQLIGDNPNAEETLDILQRLHEDSFEIESTILRKEEELETLDSAEPVTGEVWRASEVWKLQTLKTSFDAQLKWPIIEYKMWPKDKKVTWKFNPPFERGQKEISGDVTGQFMRGLNATLTLMVHRRDKYSEEITAVTSIIKEEKLKLEEKETERKTILEDKKESKKELELLDEYIAKINEEKLKCCLNAMTVAEAMNIDVHSI